MIDRSIELASQRTSEPANERETDRQIDSHLRPAPSLALLCYSTSHDAELDDCVANKDPRDWKSRGLLSPTKRAQAELSAETWIWFEERLVEYAQTAKGKDMCEREREFSFSCPHPQAQVEIRDWSLKRDGCLSLFWLSETACSSSAQ